MLGKRLALGKSGETQAARYLKQRGFKLIARNYSCKYGEIDIIAKDGDVLVFIEVKTRSQSAFGPPSSAVDGRKQIQISKAAHHYMATGGLDDIDARFDVISILAIKGEPIRIEHIANAFDFCIS